MKRSIGAVLVVLAMLPWAGVDAAADLEANPNKEVVAANTAFALDLYHQLASENDGNLSFSPYSIANALVMAAEGARGETALEMGRVLRFPQSADQSEQFGEFNPWNLSIIHDSMATINRRLSGKDPAEAKAMRLKVADMQERHAALTKKVSQLVNSGRYDEGWSANKELTDLTERLNNLLKQLDPYEIRIANALWAEKTYPFEPLYMETINNHYTPGGAFPVDFKSNHEAARQLINNWVEDQTNGRIKDLIPTDGVGELTRLILTNAIYFKGEWRTPFEAKYTKEGDFTLNTGAKAKTQLMHESSVGSAQYGAFASDGSFFQTPHQIQRGQKEGFYPDKNGFAVLELNYKGDELSMVLMAPNRHDGLASLESRLTLENLEQWLPQLEARDVHVFLPKFRLETTYHLKKTLQAMGMVQAFEALNTPKGAQFSGMTTSDHPKQQLYISQVLHKTFVEVNEKGTEAAAASALSIELKSALVMRDTVPFVPTFKADRPFVFLIRDRVTDTILFLGRIVVPPKEAKGVMP